MDYTVKNLLIHPAYLWIGPHTTLISKTVTFLQSVLCPSQSNDGCHLCQQIEQQKHHAVMWLSPEKTYTIEQLEPITNRIVFKLEHNQHCFFVIQQADLLSHACSNSLLKSVEEPPAGYHFIFLAQRAQSMLPTIQSRCIIQSFFSSQQSDHHPLFTFFTTLKLDPVAFEKEMGSGKITESESIELVNAILSYWMQQYKKEIAQQLTTIQTQKIISLLTAALKKSPMPGSSTLFWRNLFLLFSAAKKP